jgi:signal transduction histidine kinase
MDNSPSFLQFQFFDHTGTGPAHFAPIIEAHGGYIRADNESAHGGARFSLTLPAKLD